ncbi:MAG: glycosyltransferase, partial [Deltaproteobacteria bacterium]|nr:glycosyltransferase [Deltaproteobacteria bacterium]
VFVRTLHLFSNWKWTGPAEHALNAATYFVDRGCDLTFACGKPPSGVEDSLEKRAKKSGLNLANKFSLNKHLHIWHDAVDVVRLKTFIKKENIELIHTHLFNDHFVAGVAARCLSKRILIVRTIYDGLGLTFSMRNRMLLSYLTDGLIVVSETSKNVMKNNFNFSSEKIWNICPGVDCDRFNQKIDGSKARKRFGISLSNPVVGIVARVQTHRRFEVFLKSIEYAVKEVPQLKVFIIGRGTHIQEVAIKPVEVLGLKDHVVFTGYRLEDYTEILAALDIKVFLVPGSDGSCRAVREAMAMGKPVIVANRGMLPEIVEDGISGLVVEDTPENLAHAIINLAKDVGFREKMGEAARKRMIEDFNLDAQLAKVEGVYKNLSS